METVWRCDPWLKTFGTHDYIIFIFRKFIQIFISTMGIRYDQDNLTNKRINNILCKAKINLIVVKKEGSKKSPNSGRRCPATIIYSA